MRFAADRLAPYIGQSNVDTLLKLASEASWDRVYSLLELAQRARQVSPPPSRASGLISIQLLTRLPSDAVRARQQGDSPRFPAFGAARPARDPLVPPAPVLGWALSSPILFSARRGPQHHADPGLYRGSGDLRTAFESLGELALSCELSTAKGLRRLSDRQPDLRRLCDAGPWHQCDWAAWPVADPLARRNGRGDQHLPSPGAIYDSPYPILRLLLKIRSAASTMGQFRAPYAELAPLVLAAAQVHVVASGLRNLSLQNDETRLDAKKPFEPFTNQPAVGSRLLLGHPEVVGKTLDSLSLSLQWMGRRRVPRPTTRSMA